jgi:hypothetical protein
MEALNRLVSESLARHGFDRPVDYRRLRWSQWVRCESPRSLLFVPSKPGVFAIAEEVMSFGAPSVDLHVGTAAPGCPAEQRSAVAVAATKFEDRHDLEGAGFSRSVNPPANAAAEAKRMLAVLEFHEHDDMAFILDRMFSRDNPMRARLSSGRCFVRFVVIEDGAYRRNVTNSLNQWLIASAEKVTGEASALEKPSGIGAHFAASLELASTIGRAGSDDLSPPIPSTRH